MTEHVVGDWKSFHFRMIQSSDIPAVLQHLRSNFYHDEPICRNSGYDDEMADDIDSYLLNNCLKDNELNFMVVHKETNKLAGVRITSINRKGQDHPELPQFKSEKTGPMVAVNVKLLEDAKMFERYPDIDHYAEFVLVSVDRDFRGCGLASEIYDRAVKMLIAMKVPLIECVFSSPYTQKIARKRGFYELSQIKLRDWKDDKGQRYYPDATEDECAILMVKELK